MIKKFFAAAAQHWENFEPLRNRDIAGFPELVAGARFICFGGGCVADPRPAHREETRS